MTDEIAKQGADMHFIGILILGVKTSTLEGILRLGSNSSGENTCANPSEEIYQLCTYSPNRNKKLLTGHCRQTQTDCNLSTQSNHGIL